MADDGRGGPLVRDGFEIVRGFVTREAARRALDLLGDLRARVRRSISIDAQRVQPLRRHLAPERMAELARIAAFDRLREFLAARIGSGVDIEPNLLGLWIEPGRRSYVLPWHRDLRDNAKGLDWRSWYDNMTNPRFFNQFHIALVPDDSLWVVPGSHRRDDTETERRMFPTRPILVDFVERDLDPWYDGTDKYPPRFGPTWARNAFDRYYYGRLGLPPRKGLRKRNAELYERALGYCRSMPGAAQVKLEPGDVLIYRNCIWHTAIYRSEVARCTLFSNASTPESVAWVETQRQSSARLGAQARWFSRDQLG